MSPPTPSLVTIPRAASAQLHVYNGHQDIHIGDTHTASTTPDDKGMTAGFFTLARGCNATTTFGFDEYKYVIEGTFVLSDSNGNKETLRAGDVFFIPKGSTITFETIDGGKAFFAAQRPLNEARKAGVGFSKL